MPEDWQSGGFGLYLHWPFCAAKCPYCDFNSHVAAEIDQTRWQAAYISELDRYGAETAGRVLQSIYFGGGTPSLMQPALVAAILERAGDLWTFANDVEITLEANPTSVEAGRFAGYRAAGVNRVSVGVQALNDADLRRLGRRHSAAEARAALQLARKTFERVNFDLIYARQDQSLQDWQAELDEALALGLEHLSLYQLTIEPGTAFGDRLAAGGLHGLPGEDLSADMFFLTQALCDAAGFPAYEVSNHARPGQESRHNLMYWRSGDYIGIGPGAHGRLTLNGVRYATETPLQPAAWLSAVDGGRGGESLRTRLSGADQAGEFLMMGLRTGEGVDLARYQRRSDAPIDHNKIKGLADLGLVELDRDVLRTTAQGRPLLNAILRELLPD